MVLLSADEALDLVVMILVVGYLFKDVFRRPSVPQVLTMQQSGDGSYRLGEQYLDVGAYLSSSQSVWRRDLLFSVAVTAPAIVFHELAHKYTAIMLGLGATFHASYGGLLLGIFMKHFLGFIAFVPGFVVPRGVTTPLGMALIAFAGPALNLVLWLTSTFALRKNLLARHMQVLYLTSEINKILFILNMLPVPFFDGFTVYTNLFRALF
ncbi:hypothetical protein J4439_03945 [Candidatus Woesearchaeota archaeon]|nr:hypothetical protein [Candidatus Woesearchaeota archaeon]